MLNTFFSTLSSDQRKIFFSCVLLLSKSHVFRYLIESKVKSQRGDISRLAATANVSQLQLEVVPAAVGHVNLIQTQAHQSGSAAGHGEHQLAIYHLEETWRTQGRTRKHKEMR